MKHSITGTAIALTLALFLGGVVAQDKKAPKAKPGTAQMPWEKTLDAALQRAKAEGRPVMVCFNMDGERANNKMAKNHYHDAAIVKRASNFVLLPASKYDHTDEIDGICPRFGLITCQQHKVIELEMRERYLKTDKVTAPQHYFLKKDGKTHLTKLFYLDKKDFDQLMVAVLRPLLPAAVAGEPVAKSTRKTEKKGANGSGAGTAEGRNSKSPSKDGEDNGDDDKEPEEEKAPEPETPAELRAAILATNDTWTIKKHTRRLVKMAKDEKNEEAGAIVSELLSEKEHQKKWPAMLLAHGWKGNKDGVKVIEPFLKHKNEDIRNHAVVALEDIADKSALKALYSRFKKEKKERVIKNLVRAMGTCADQKRSVGDRILKASKSGSALVRRNAYIALGNFKKHTKAEKALINVVFNSGSRGGGRGSRNGGGGRGGRLNDRLAAAMGLAGMESKAGRKKAREWEKQNENSPWARVIEGVVDLINGDTDRDSDEFKRERQRIGSDKIRRDLDPEVRKSGDGNGNRNRNRNRDRNGRNGRGDAADDD